MVCWCWSCWALDWVCSRRHWSSFRWMDSSLFAGHSHLHSGQEVVVVDSGVVAAAAAVVAGIGLEIDSSSEVTAAMMERKRIDLIADMKIIVRI